MPKWGMKEDCAIAAKKRKPLPRQRSGEELKALKDVFLENSYAPFR